MENCVRVKIADWAVLKKSGFLVTIGLGSCVGIALYDPQVKVAGLAHILLSESNQFANKDNPAKYGDTAVPLLIREMNRLGASPQRLRAKIAGGSELFNFKCSAESVGARNIDAVKNALALARIPLLAADVGGNSGRTMKVYAENGYVFISKVGQKEREI